MNDMRDNPSLRDFEAAWAMHQCPEIVRLRAMADQDAEVIIPALLVCCTVMRATEIIEDRVIEVADRIIDAVTPERVEGDEPDGSCTDPRGHDWAISDTDRCYCMNCGADGDG